MLNYARFHYILQDITEQLPDFRREYFPALERVNDHFQHLHGILQIREQDLERQIIDIYKNSFEPIAKLVGCFATPIILSLAKGRAI